MPFEKEQFWAFALLANANRILCVSRNTDLHPFFKQLSKDLLAFLKTVRTEDLSSFYGFLLQ